MITIVGAGALGSHVSLFLRNADRPLKVVDFDRVEQKNTQAQFHTKMGLSKNKTKALQQTLGGLFGTRIFVVPYKLAEGNADQVLLGSDLVLDCTDNAKSRHLILDRCVDYDIPCLHGCLSADGTFARVIWSDMFVPDAEGEEGEATCEVGGQLPFFTFVASLVALEAQSFLATGRRRSYHVAGSEVTRI